jgi:hypothetical protein
MRWVPGGELASQQVSELADFVLRLNARERVKDAGHDEFAGVASSGIRADSLTCELANLLLY